MILKGREAWSALGLVQPAQLRDPLVEVHWAVRLLAALGQSFAEPRPDDSHRALSWNGARGAFLTRPLRGASPFEVALRPNDLGLELIGDSRHDRFELPGETYAAALEWLARLPQTGVSGPDAIGQPEFELPEHEVGSGAPFAIGREAARQAITGLYASAAELLGRVRTSENGASEVLCWPHHFDIATLLTVEADAHGAATKTIGIGMAPVGGGYRDWYWYVTPWPYPGGATLPDLGAHGAWHTEGLTGAVLTADEIVRIDAPSREDFVWSFVGRATDAARSVLGRV